MTALADGGFAVVYDNDEDDTIDMVRYDASGASVGGVVTVNSAGTESQPEILGLSDGRIAVTWQEIGTGQDIRMAIYDTRDTVNDPVYEPDDFQIGTVGDDIFTATADFAFGHDGDDEIADGGGNNQIDAGAGNDTVTILGVDSNETVDGGTGIDTLTGQSIFNGTVYDLAAQEVRDGGTTQSALNFENVTGTTANEELIGSFDDNTLLGGGGDDTISGDSGIDILEGGAGNDLLFGGSTFDDTLLGGIGNDTLEAVGGGLIDGGAAMTICSWCWTATSSAIPTPAIATCSTAVPANDTFDASNETSVRVYDRPGRADDRPRHSGFPHGADPEFRAGGRNRAGRHPARLERP
ncbi:calcium-binding protein [Rhodophyticola sp.]|uniref:calcium-binding protein n=1 Tax=Rhodophyticola sp. TaxID=2680032 RepID=UPI003D2834F1